MFLPDSEKCSKHFYVVLPQNILWDHFQLQNFSGKEILFPQKNSLLSVVHENCEQPT